MDAHCERWKISTTKLYQSARIETLTCFEISFYKEFLKMETNATCRKKMRLPKIRFPLTVLTVADTRAVRVSDAV